MIHTTFLQHEMSDGEIGRNFFDMLRAEIPVNTRKRIRVFVVGGSVDQPRVAAQGEGDRLITESRNAALRSLADLGFQRITKKWCPPRGLMILDIHTSERVAGIKVWDTPSGYGDPFYDKEFKLARSESISVCA